MWGKVLRKGKGMEAEHYAGRGSPSCSNNPEEFFFLPIFTLTLLTGIGGHDLFHRGVVKTRRQLRSLHLISVVGHKQ